MKKLFITISILIITNVCIAQINHVKYYNNQYLMKEVSHDKAKYSQTTIEDSLGNKTIFITVIRQK